jgi:hypothetical protein
MSEMHTISCPSCESNNQPLAAVDGIQEYRCSACGMVYYGPCGCDLTHDSATPARGAVRAALTSSSLGACTVACGDDWQTMTPPVDTRDKAATVTYLGC